MELYWGSEMLRVLDDGLEQVGHGHPSAWPVNGRTDMADVMAITVTI